MDTIYKIPAALLQAIVQLLNDLPARTSRGVLNAIEVECTRQDGERDAEAKQAWVLEAVKAQGVGSIGAAPQ